MGVLERPIGWSGAANWADGLGFMNSVTFRISGRTYKRLLQIQGALKDQKDEHHSLIAVLEKVVLNAKPDVLYGVEIEEPLERIT